MTDASLPRRGDCAALSNAHAETGIASVYSYGTRTANGKRFNPISGQVKAKTN